MRKTIYEYKNVFLAVCFYLAFQAEERRDLGVFITAERTVGGETDFTLASEQITIDAQENLRGQRINVYIPDADWTLDMRGRNGNQVLIDQQQGRFTAPFLDISGPDIDSSAEDAGMDFDLKNFVSGGEGTQNSDSFRDRAD